MAEHNPSQKPFRGQDLTGKEYGLWTVLSFAGRSGTVGKSYNWKCKCRCGTERIVASKSLTCKGRKSNSCGCVNRTLHGQYRCPEYYSWTNMKTRCYNKKCKYYSYYGGRGVKVCSRWLESFQNFIDDMGKRPTPKHSLDRYPDVDGDYTPENCRWATAREQSNNRRNSRRISLGNDNLTVAEWSRKTGIQVCTIWMRLERGWTSSDAVTKPVNRKLHPPRDHQSSSA